MAKHWTGHWYYWEYQKVSILKKLKSLGPPTTE